MNNIVFAAKVRSSGNENKFDVEFKHRIIESSTRKSSMYGLVFASGDVRFINENENIRKALNFQDKIIELIAMENIVPKLKREAFFSL